MSEPSHSSADSADSTPQVPGKWKIGCAALIILTLLLATIGAVSLWILTTASREITDACPPRPTERITIITRSLEDGQESEAEFVVSAPVDSTPSAGIQHDQTPHQQVAVGQPVVSPDGSHVAVPVSWSRLNDSALYPYAGSLFVVGSDGSNPRAVAYGQFKGVTWSPDGNRIAYSKGLYFDRGEIWVVARDGDSWHKLSDDPSSTHPSWSPDGSRIAYRSADRDAVIVQELTSGAQTAVAREGNYPSWSPDGTRLAYASSYIGVGLTTTRLDGTDKREVLTSGPPNPTSVMFPQWSPDGTQVLFVEAMGDPHMATVRLANDEVTRYETLQDGRSIPSWLPNSNQIIQARPESDCASLAVYNQ